jgi:hypothetical protein
VVGLAEQCSFGLVRSSFCVMERAPERRSVSAVSGPVRQIAGRASGSGSSPHPSTREPEPRPLDSAMRENAMTRALIVGVATLALSASAALAQAPNWDVYPGYGYAPYGLGYAASAPLYDYAAPGFGYAASAPLYNYAAPGLGYAAPAGAPARAGTTIIIVNPAPAYAAPRPLYSYAPGYWGGYGGWGGYGRWRAGYGW